MLGDMRRGRVKRVLVGFPRLGVEVEGGDAVLFNATGGGIEGSFHLVGPGRVLFRHGIDVHVVLSFDSVAILSGRGRVSGHTR